MNMNDQIIKFFIIQNLKLNFNINLKKNKKLKFDLNKNEFSFK